MLIRFTELFDVESARRAVGAFTCYDATTAAGVARAAEQRGVPAIVLVSEASLHARRGRLLLPTLLAVAASSDAPMCVQLDHARDQALIREALALGAGAVLADGSMLPVERNIEFVRAVSAIARSRGAGVEAELGSVHGDEDGRAAATANGGGAMTDPEAVAGFVERTGCDLLAIAVGNRHGAYTEPPSLDWSRFSDIRARTSVPLALHGGSGIPVADLRRLIAGGVRKVNVNTEIRARQFAALRGGLDRFSVGHRMLDLQGAVEDAAAEAAGAVFDSFSEGG